MKAAQTKDLTTDWKFGIAYNAALKLCTILPYAEGYRSENVNAHYRTLQAISEILGETRKSDPDYLNTCRSKRNTVEYDYVGGTAEDDVAELIKYSVALRQDVMQYLKEKYPSLLITGKANKRNKKKK